ncbi:hypothetical protein FJZ19_01330 [Candidatus Pacearchaeota archaeon]|nr:hypothetical protein [Candidatus Pacearchaeota archaeon]
MSGNPATRQADVAFREQVIKYTLGDTASICPIYLSFEAGRKVPNQCRSCNGTRETCQTFQLYLDVRRTVQ